MHFTCNVCFLGVESCLLTAQRFVADAVYVRSILHLGTRILMLCRNVHLGWLYVHVSGGIIHPACKQTQLMFTTTLILIFVPVASPF